MITIPKLYKILVGGKSCHNSKNQMEWSLPKGKRPGRWHKVDGPVIPCFNGLHLVDYDHIGHWFSPDCQIFEVETKGGLIQHDAGTPGEKWVASQVRLLRRIPAPEYWLKVVAFINSIKTVSFFNPTGPPKPEWNFFETRAAAKAAARAAAWEAARDAARDNVLFATRDATINAARAAARAAARTAAGNAAWKAAKDASRDAAGDAAWDAAGDAFVDADLMARVLICDGLSLDEKHIAHVKARWEVWQMGYGLLCDVDGVLYVYRRYNDEKNN